MTSFEIRPYRRADKPNIIALSMRSWAPVFDKTENDVPSYVYRAFYPDGWQERQTGDVEAFLDSDGGHVWVAEGSGEIVGFVGLRLHPEDKMGEVYILAVDPAHQRTGVASALITFSEDRMKEAGMDIAMVETGGDAGHESARLTYKSTGYELWPVARYFKKL